MKSSPPKPQTIERGDYVRFAHLPAKMHPTPILVVEVTPRGLIRLFGWAGTFAPHLFVVVKKSKEAA